MLPEGVLQFGASTSINGVLLRACLRSFRRLSQSTAAAILCEPTTVMTRVERSLLALE